MPVHYTNKIDGAYYTGSDTANEFATIPNPEDGDYTVVTEGTGSGDYKVEVAKISEDENNPGQAMEADAAITGTAIVGDVETASAIVSGNSVTTGDQDNTPPETTTNIDAMLAKIKYYFQLGYITSRGTEMTLLARLNAIKVEMKLLNIFRNKKFPEKIKGQLVKNLQKNINRQITDLESQLQSNKNFQNTIAAKVRGIIIEDLESLRS